MRTAAGRIVLKIVILLGCIACVITKVLTDQLSRRVFLRNQKYSREWPLLHNLYWSSSGNTFASVTYGGFTLITVLMLISRFIDAKSRPTLVEKIFLTVGMLCFFAMGGVVFSAYDQVPADLHTNAIVLGCLSFAVALLMLLDLADPMARHTSDTTQTDFPISMVHPQPAAVQPTPLHFANGNQHQQYQQPPASASAVIVKETNTNVVPQHQRPPSPASSPDLDASHGQYTRGDAVDYVHSRQLPTAQPSPPAQMMAHRVERHPNAIHQYRAEPAVFEKVLLPEKQRPRRTNVVDPGDSFAQLQYSNLAQLQQHQLQQHQPMRPPPRPVPPPIPYRQQHAQQLQPAGQRPRVPHIPQRPPAPQFKTPPPPQPSGGTGRHVHHHHQQQQQQQTTAAGHSAGRRKSASSGHQRRGQPCGSGSSDDDGRPSAIQPGFVANAARFWDQRVQQHGQQPQHSGGTGPGSGPGPGELNTIV